MNFKSASSSDRTLKYARCLLPPLKYSKSRASPRAEIDICDLSAARHSFLSSNQETDFARCQSRFAYTHTPCGKGATSGLYSRNYSFEIYFQPPADVGLEIECKTRRSVCATLEGTPLIDSLRCKEVEVKAPWEIGICRTCSVLRNRSRTPGINIRQGERRCRQLRKNGWKKNGVENRDGVAEA